MIANGKASLLLQKNGLKQAADSDIPDFTFVVAISRYVSTYTHCQSIIEKEGVFGGPGRADEYLKRLSNPSFLGNPDCQNISPPKDFGTTMTMIFEAGIVFSEKQRKKLHQKSDIVKGWSLSDFWEHTTWPRDSNGNGNTRFGLPVLEDRDPEDEPLISDNPRQFPRREFEESEPSDMKIAPQPAQNNPYVLNVAGVYGMTTEIVDKELDSIMYLSAKFCKTCKSISPLYTRMARLAQEKSSSVKFVKAEASGPYGKALGRRLEVDAVPAFILFRNGKRYGTPLSVTKLPSTKIDKALELLESGKPWDESVLEEES
jgi:thiol-disulfide isomerase/thioredoxin